MVTYGSDNGHSSTTSMLFQVAHTFSSVAIEVLSAQAQHLREYGGQVLVKAILSTMRFFDATHDKTRSMT
jgi:hypothetical protein